MAESSGREHVGGEEGKGCDVAEVGGEICRFGGEIGEGCACVGRGGKSEEGGEGEGGESCRDTLGEVSYCCWWW